MDLWDSLPIFYSHLRRPSNFLFFLQTRKKLISIPFAFRVPSKLFLLENSLIHACIKIILFYIRISKLLQFKKNSAIKRVVFLLRNASYAYNKNQLLHIFVFYTRPKMIYLAKGTFNGLVIRVNINNLLVF